MPGIVTAATSRSPAASGIRDGFNTGVVSAVLWQECFFIIIKNQQTAQQRYQTQQQSALSDHNRAMGAYSNGRSYQVRRANREIMTVLKTFLSPGHWPRIFFVVFSLALFVPVLPLFAQALHTQNFEVPANRRASEILPANVILGPHYRIRESVVSYGYLHNWTVDSDFGTFHATGDGALRKLLKEIRAIAALRKIKTSDAVVRSLKQAAKSPFVLAKKLVTHPVDTLSGIPKGIFSIFGNVTKGITMKHDPSEDARIKQILFVSSWKRDFAFEHGVDVYSSNTVLQKELNSVGWAAAITGLITTVAAGASGVTAVTAMKNLRTLNQVNNALKEEPPPRLRLINEKKLAKMGVSKDLAKKFLDHPHFTPRHDTVITFNLENLRGARGRDTFLKFALSAEDETGANYFQQMAETMRGYHVSASPITAITVVGGMVVAQTQAGSAFIPFPLDHGVWSAMASRIIGQVKQDYRSAGFNGTFEMWLAGTVTPLARSNLQRLGFRVTENVDERIGFID